MSWIKLKRGNELANELGLYPPEDWECGHIEVEPLKVKVQRGHWNPRDGATGKGKSAEEIKMEIFGAEVEETEEGTLIIDPDMDLDGDGGDGDELSVEVTGGGDGDEATDRVCTKVTIGLVADVDTLNDRFKEILEQSTVAWIIRIGDAIEFLGKLPRAARYTGRESNALKKYREDLKEIEQEYLWLYAHMIEILAAGGESTPPDDWQDFTGRVKALLTDFNSALGDYEGMARDTVDTRNYIETIGGMQVKLGRSYDLADLVADDARKAFRKDSDVKVTSTDDGDEED